MHSFLKFHRLMAGGVLHTLGGIPVREYFSVREYFRILTLGRMQIDVKHPGLRLDGCSRTEPRVAELPYGVQVWYSTLIKLGTSKALDSCAVLRRGSSA